MLACRGRRGVGGWEGRKCGGQGRRRRRKIKKGRREKGEEGGVLTRYTARFDFCLSTSIPVLTTSTYVVAWPQGDQILGGGACDTRGQGRTTEPGKHTKNTEKYDKRRNHLICGRARELTSSRALRSPTSPRIPRFDRKSSSGIQDPPPQYLAYQGTCWLRHSADQQPDPTHRVETPTEEPSPRDPNFNGGAPSLPQAPDRKERRGGGRVSELTKRAQRRRGSAT